MNDTITGRCLCRKIEFEFSGDVNWVLNCHCETCRRSTSSPMTTWVSVPNENFKFVKGVPCKYSSSKGVLRKFCSDCGSPLSYESEKMPGEIHLYLASLDDPNILEPTCHVFESEKLSWFEVHDTLARYATTRKGGAIKPDHFGPKEV
ncbi:GFA family protein [Pelagibacterium halotolerans]|uniref:GFA family protein n=1 Tax=Pelagibacterium halotolerans TaxID=531813 RepID=UPI00384D6FB6